MTTYPEFDSAELACDGAKRRTRETGDLHCAMQWQGRWIVYALGYGPVEAEDEED